MKNERARLVYNGNRYYDGELEMVASMFAMKSYKRYFGYGLDRDNKDLLVYIQDEKGKKDKSEVLRLSFDSLESHVNALSGLRREVQTKRQKHPLSDLYRIIHKGVGFDKSSLDLLCNNVAVSTVGSDVQFFRYEIVDEKKELYVHCNKNGTPFKIRVTFNQLVKEPTLRSYGKVLKNLF